MNLLDTSTPFDEQKLGLLEKVVTMLYSAKNSNDVNMANKILNEFKLLPDAWTYCDLILTKGQSVHAKFFSLGIMEDVIKAKWNLLLDEQKLGIRNFLVDILIKNVTDEQSFAHNSHFINKLNHVIVLV